MKRIAMFLKRPPYGDMNAAEAVRHAMGAVADDLSVCLILTDGGVLLAKKGHDMTDTGFTNLEEALKDCIDMGVEVYADAPSAQAFNLSPADMIGGVGITESRKIAELVRDADTTMLF